MGLEFQGAKVGKMDETLFYSAKLTLIFVIQSSMFKIKRKVMSNIE